MVTLYRSPLILDFALAEWRRTLSRFTRCARRTRLINTQTLYTRLHTHRRGRACGEALLTRARTSAWLGRRRRGRGRGASAATTAGWLAGRLAVPTRFCRVSVSAWRRGGGGDWPSVWTGADTAGRLHGLREGQNWSQEAAPAPLRFVFRFDDKSVCFYRLRAELFLCCVCSQNMPVC